MNAYQTHGEPLETDDGLDPARGIVFALIVSAAFWCGLAWWLI